MVGLRRAYRPLRPELDNFLFAAVGAERDGIPLSMISALTRLGLDPWDEAGRLSSLDKREAVEQLARLLAELSGAFRPLAEARDIAAGLVERLPQHHADERSAQPAQLCRRSRYRIVGIPPIPSASRLWIICLALAAAVAIGIILRGGSPFGGGP
jgi:hypothetical protein